MTFSLVSSTVHRKRGTKHKYTKDEVDYFALYNVQMDVLILMPYELVKGKNAITLQYNPGKSHNQFPIIDWRNYTFDKIISVETLHETSSVNDEDKVQTTTDNSGLSN